MNTQTLTADAEAAVAALLGKAETNPTIQVVLSAKFRIGGFTLANFSATKTVPLPVSGDTSALVNKELPSQIKLLSFGMDGVNIELDYVPGVDAPATASPETTTEAPLTMVTPTTVPSSVPAFGTPGAE